MYVKGLGGIKHWCAGDSRMSSKDWTVGEGQKCIGSLHRAGNHYVLAVVCYAQGHCTMLLSL